MEKVEHLSNTTEILSLFIEQFDAGCGIFAPPEPEEHRQDEPRTEPIPFTRENENMVESTKIRLVSISKIRVSGLNDQIYKQVDPDDPSIEDLVDSICELGLLDPLVISEDYFILSGHRRFAAIKLTNMEEIPCEIRQGVRLGDPNFLRLLREYNRQRVKGVDEIIREQAVDASESDRQAIEKIRIDRVRRSEITIDAMEIEGTKKRASITKAKWPFLMAIQKVIRESEDFWPLSDRQIHYMLLNKPPLIHAKKKGSTYRNDRKSYQALCELLTRARLTGLIPWDVIADPTRPMVTWSVFASVEPFIKKQMSSFMDGYYRDYMQSQPHHLEIIGEKNTIEGIIKPVAMEFCIPYTIGRGYSSIQPRHDLFLRYRNSNKKKLILLMLSDHNPDGEEIAQSFARSMRDDFGIEDIHPIKVALNRDQVDSLHLTSIMKAKAGSSNYDKFVSCHGDDVYELEAVAPKVLQDILRNAISSVIDVDTLNREKEQEHADMLALRSYKEKVLKAMG
jgi:hypothetical protein